MEISDYTDAHLEACVSLFHEVYNELYPHYEKRFLQKERFYSIFREHVLPANKILLLEDGGGLIGFMAIGSNFVDQLYIRSDFRGKGMGTLLLNKAKLLYPQKLELYTMAENEKAIRFYEKHGFKIIKRGIAPDEQKPDVLMAWENYE